MPDPLQTLAAGYQQRNDGPTAPTAQNLADRSNAELWTPAAQQQYEQITAAIAAGLEPSPTVRLALGYAEVAKQAATTLKEN